MSLRRFPWKLPRMTDNSFRLFASEPTPGHNPEILVSASKRSTQEPSGKSASEEESKSHSHHHRSHSKKEGSSATEGADGESTAPQSQTHGSSDKKEVIRGPWRILRLLPRESRHIIWRMLELDPKKRATMGEVLQEPWVADTIICQQLDNGEVVPAEDHTHVLEPPNSQPQPPQKS